MIGGAKAKKSKRRCDTLPVLHPDAAGIDVGTSELYVAVSADRELRRLQLMLQSLFLRDLPGIQPPNCGDRNGLSGYCRRYPR